MKRAKKLQKALSGRGLSSVLRWGLVLFVACLLLTACGEPRSGSLTTCQLPDFHEELARQYAPVIRQGAASDQDFITAVDFDGDWVSDNNWENQPEGDLSAYVYYSVIETETHWFVFYSLFHPRDYTRNPCENSGGCHENDLESIQVVVAKDGTTYGRLQAVETVAHGDIFLYSAEESVTRNFLSVQASVRLEEGHPVVWVEVWGHGIYAAPKFSPSDTVIYRVGEEAEVPESLDDDDVSYQLVPIYETLWPRREEIGSGQAFDQPFDYRGQTLPATLDGEDFGEDKANTPWGYNQAIGDTLSRGDFFLDPAKALAYHASFEGGFSSDYDFNPYLTDLGLVDACGE